MDINLVDDDHICVFCGQVSAKGIVAAEGHNRFFACSSCLEDPLIRVAMTKRRPSGREDRGHMCVACGREWHVGLQARGGGNWFFLCQRCLHVVLPEILIAWIEFGGKRRGERQQAPAGAISQSAIMREVIAAGNQGVTMWDIRDELKNWLQRQVVLEPGEDISVSVEDQNGDTSEQGRRLIIKKKSKEEI
ncbi:MAG TPA: hypothetical protein VKK79_22545 [Candidatus Lokiarchaeia archaeon]|nr:hypothetical protein [Candidatus Lokiarchaeia archaeon]